MPTSSGQGQTPTTSSTPDAIQSASQDQQNANFPFIALAIGVPGATAAIVFFFIGWWLLRKHLLPVKNAKLPPSGANPWSRVRTSDTPWNMNVNGNIQPFGSNNPEGTPDINNPYLKELIKQYSDKSRAARQQKLSNTSNDQAGPTRNDETWLR